MTRRLSKTTMLILAQSAHLTNRQIADALGFDIDTVRFARYRNKHLYNIPKRDRDLRERIAAYYGCNDADAVAAALGCSKSYLQRIWREIKNAERQEV